jgi:O-antigen/teichoic acid export membrane protein
LITSIVVTRALGVSDKGAFALLMLAPLLGARLSSLGTEAALVVRGARVPVSVRIAHSVAIVVLCGAVGVAAVLGLQFAGALPGRELVDGWMLLAAALALPLNLATYVLNGLLRGAGLLRLYDRGLLVGPLLQLPAVVLLLYGLHWGIEGALLASLGATSATVLYLLFSVRRQMHPGRDLSPDTTRSRPRLHPEILRFGLQEHAGNLAQHLNLRLDLLLVGIFLGPLATGIYTVSIALAEIVWFVPDAVGTVLLPRVALGDPKTARAATASACRISLGAATLVALSLAVSGAALIRLLYGAAFLPAWMPLLGLLPGTLLLTVSKVLSKYLSGIGRPSLVARASGYSLVATVLLDLLCIPLWGLMGAAVATTLSYGVHAAVCTLAFRRLTGADLGEVCLPRRGDAMRLVELLPALHASPTTPC